MLYIILKNKLLYIDIIRNKGDQIYILFETKINNRW